MQHGRSVQEYHSVLKNGAETLVNMHKKGLSIISNKSRFGTEVLYETSIRE